MNIHFVDRRRNHSVIVQGILYPLNECEKKIKEVTVEEAGHMARFASVSGVTTASTRGAMRALPTLYEVHDRLAKQKS